MIPFFKRLMIAVIAVSAITINAYAADGYEPVSPPQPARTDGKIEVLEFFWFGCGHCYRFHPYLEEWKKTLPDDVVFTPVPVAWNKGAESHARAYLAAEVLGVTEQFEKPLFDAIHKQKKRIVSPATLADFAASQGIDRKKFLKTMEKSFAVDTKLRRAKQLAAAYKISGVPTVTIAGKYLTSGSIAGTYPRVIAVINELIEKERAARLASNN